jgi:hypothetical protein
MKALLIIWTIIFKVGVSQTTTPLESMDICEAAKENIVSTSSSSYTDRLDEDNILVMCVPI